MRGGQGLVAPGLGELLPRRDFDHLGLIIAQRVLQLEVQSRKELLPPHSPERCGRYMVVLEPLLQFVRRNFCFEIPNFHVLAERLTIWTDRPCECFQKFA